MKERATRILNAIALAAGLVLIAVAFYIGCRALNNDPSLWLFAAVGSPRGAETFAAPSYYVRIAWKASPGGAQGYMVYLRKSGVNYTVGQDVGTNRVLRVPLERKTTYRVVVKAYNGNVQSAPSEEVSFRTGKNQNDPVEQL